SIRVLSQPGILQKTEIPQLKDALEALDTLLREKEAAFLHQEFKFLGDRYRIQDPIGRGGMATIYRGRDLQMDRVVAIKVLREVYSTDPKFVARFQLEAK